ncbi:MAG: pyridoxal phosphate-dependent aminotransferase [bacterium]|nr:pyridoxal phosphate-dependent aminotransferase [bacterium]
MPSTAVQPVAAEYRFARLRARLQRQGDELLDFAFGSYRPAPPEQVAVMLAETAGTALDTATDAEMSLLEEDLTAMLNREYDLEVPPGGILATPSGRAALSVLVDSVVRAGDQVLTTTPGYPVLAELVAQRGGRICEARLDPGRDFAPDLQGVAAVDRARIAFAGVNYPNNPTGAVATPEIVELLRTGIPDNALLFNDATYAPLVFQGAGRSLLESEQLELEGRRTVELHSLTKPFSLGPLGMALLVGPESLIREIRRNSEYRWAPLSSLTVRIGRCCARDWGYLCRLRAELAHRVARLRVVLEGIGFRPFPTRAGMHVLCDTPSALNGAWLGGAHEAGEVLLDEWNLATVTWEETDAGYLRFSALYSDRDLEALEDLRGRLSLEYAS